jgi:ATP synthase protein I
MAAQPSPERDPKKEERRGQHPGVQFARYSQMAFILPAATVVGLLAGMALDRWLGTGWLYIVGLILGIVAGAVELMRMMLRASRE